MQYVKEKGIITNKEYQKINAVSRQMATNESHSLAICLTFWLTKDMIQIVILN